MDTVAVMEEGTGAAPIPQRMEVVTAADTVADTVEATPEEL
jgi:hypothetical protein